MTEKLPQPSLTPETIDVDPIKQFSHWLAEAEQAERPLYNAMTLATASPTGKPSARMVLLKEVDLRGFIFYTNYESRKACEIKENTSAALVFYWPALSRQVRIEGTVEVVDRAASERYFASRPRGHQIEAHASPQSRVIQDWAFLEQRFQAVTEQFSAQQVPRPANWGGYRLIPEVVEFWQEGEHRLHDRLRYRRGNTGNWIIERLAP
ncbi:MAG: pyridoxamine 5'-phosphate oxidase [Desulfuromonadales bacterium]